MTLFSPLINPGVGDLRPITLAVNESDPAITPDEPPAGQPTQVLGLALTAHHIGGDGSFRISITNLGEQPYERVVVLWWVFAP